MTVSSRVVPVDSPHDSIVYCEETEGVKVYQRLRETSGWQLGRGGSPAVVAPRVSAATDVRCGNGPPDGMISAPAQRSFAGGTLGPSMRIWYCVMGAPPPSATG